jgi:hypothetical protein
MGHQLGSLFRAILCGSEVVLLDLNSNRYKILDEKSSTALVSCLSSNANQSLLSDDENNKVWIHTFLEAGILEPSDQDGICSLVKPLKTGGLKDYSWVLQKCTLPFSQVSLLDTIECFFSLFSMDRLIRRKGFKGIIDFLRKKRQREVTWIFPSDASLYSLRACLDLACRYYPGEVVCLLWAVTFAYMALDRGWDINLVVGGQLYPFFAHAWIEKQGKVIGDRDDLNLYLGVFLREPLVE